MQPKLYMLRKRLNTLITIWEYDWMPSAWAKKWKEHMWMIEIIKYNLIAEGWWKVTFLRHRFFPKERFCSQRGGVSFHSKPSRFVTILSNNWNLWSNPTALSLRILTAQKCLIWRIQTPAILRFKPLQGARILRDGVILHNDSKTVFLMAKPDFFHEFYYPQTNPWHGGSPVLMNEWLHLKINGNILASMIVCTYRFPEPSTALDNWCLEVRRNSK